MCAVSSSSEAIGSVMENPCQPYLVLLKATTLDTLFHPVDASQWGLNFDPEMLGYPSLNYLNVSL